MLLYLSVALLIGTLLAALAGIFVALRSAHGAQLRDEEMRERISELQVQLANSLELLSALKQRQSTEAVRAQERLEVLVRELSRVAAMAQEARRETNALLSTERSALDARLGEIRVAVEHKLEAIRSDNERQLDRMRHTVDEKLTTTLNDRLTVSFKQVSDQLEAVYRGLGDMRSVAAGVGDLKRVLGNVKTRGILGEVQLGAILSEILAPAQYETNVVTVPGSTERVEFAVRIPVEGDRGVLLPIDAKFPADTYEHLLDALDTAEPGEVRKARTQLDARIRDEARTISAKYVSVPHTTAFAIMFLPFEGLYAEVVSHAGLVEELSRDFHVCVAGPSTMAALLNSLQTSYQTFKLQRQTDEVLRVLSAVKAELPKYQEQLRLAHQQIERAGRTVDGIITTRTNQIERKLKGLGALQDEHEVAEVLGLDRYRESCDKTGQEEE